MKWVVLILISAVAGSPYPKSEDAIALEEISPNDAEREEEKRDATTPLPPLDVETLKNDPLVKVAVEKVQTLLKDPRVQGILASDQVKTLLAPANLKKMFDDGTMAKLATRQSFIKLLGHPVAQPYLNNPQVQAFMVSEQFKQMLQKLALLYPQLFVYAKEYVDKKVAEKATTLF